MNPELERRIEAQDAWTFQECLGLASEFGTKVRVVVALVMMKGKRYSEGENRAGPASDGGSPAGRTTAGD